MLILSLAVFSVTLLANLSAIEGHYHQQYYQQQPRTCQYWVNGYIQRGPCQNGGGGQVGHYVKPIKKVIKKVLRPLHGRPHQPQHRPQPVPQYPARQPKQHYPSDRCVTTDGLAGCCKPQAFCYFQYDSITVYAANLCIQPNGQQGICCPDKEIREPLNPYSPIRIPPKIQNVAKVPKIHERDLNSAAEHSRKVIQETLEVEQSLARRGFFQRKGSMQAQHQGFFGKQTDISRTIAKDGLINLETSIRIARQFRLNPQQARDGLSKFSLRNTALFEHCIKEPKCYPSKYRTYDGSCNNLEKPLWGRSHTAMTRLLPPAYADGLNELRRAKDEDELPLPRVVSRNLAHDKDIPDRKFTLIVMQWGQFLDHDLTLAASTRVDSIEGEGILCCPDDLGAKADLVHPSCKPIWIDDNDPFYAKRKEPVTCLNFIRNAPSPRPGCTLGYEICYQ
ncbi:Chorion peroxidase [Halotydeus destructor]|nr:Chorion peroxidase [Halotydeus destructor]